MRHSKYTLRAAAIAALLATPVDAFETGDILLRAGLTNVSPDDSSSNVVVGGTDLGIGVSVDSNTQLGVNAVYFLTPQWVLEVLAATPFSHDIDLATVGALGSTKHLPPTVSANYYLTAADSAFQAYVGLGLNYTIFFDEEFTSANQDAGFSDLSLDDSFGLSAQVGVDYQLSNTWYLNASARYINIETDASFDLGGATGEVSVDINPWVYSATLGYKF